MQNIIIDREFQELLPPLDKKTYRLLEESILAQGVLTPLVVWDSDGKHRYTNDKNAVIAGDEGQIDSDILVLRMW